MLTAKLGNDLMLKLPDECKSICKPGSEFIVGTSGDMLLLKPIRKPIWECAREIPDPDQPTLEEIDEIVHEVRREMREKKDGK